MKGPVYPAGPPVNTFDNVNEPVSRDNVLTVVTSTVSPLAVIVTIPSFGVPELSLNVGVPNE